MVNDEWDINVDGLLAPHAAEALIFVCFFGIPEEVIHEDKAITYG